MWVNKSTVLLAVAIFLFTVAYNPASAKEITVDDNGSDADFRSIQKAVNCSSSGDVILVYPGIYNESVDIGIQNISVLSESENPEDTTVRAFKLSVNNITVSGFSVQESLTLQGYTFPSGYSYYPVGNCTVNNNILKSGIYSSKCYNSAIEKNVFLDSGIIVNGLDSFNSKISDNLISNGIIIVFRGPYNYSLVNNTLLNGNIRLTESSNNKILGNYISNSQEDSGIALYESYSNEIKNNTVVNCSYGISVDLSSRNIINNNTVKFNNQGVKVGDSIDNSLLNNTISTNNIGILLSRSFIANSGTNLLSNNTISNNNIGISFEGGSSGNLVTNNKVELNKQYGVYTKQVNYKAPYNGPNWFYNNIFNNTINFFNDAGNYTENNYTEQTINNSFGIISAVLNTTRVSGINIIDGPYLGGNFWAKPDSTGFSETCMDSDKDGICDLPYNITGNCTDYLPLTTSPVRYADGELILTEYMVTTNESRQEEPAIYGDRVVWRDFRNRDPNIYMYDLSTHEESQISTSGNAADPAIHNDITVWMEIRNGNWGIHMYDISTSKETQIITNKSDMWFPAIYEDKIVWIDYRNGKVDVHTYNISTSTETQITTDESRQNNPDIYGDRVVWEDTRNRFGDSGSIYMYNLSTFRETQLTLTGSEQSQPAIYGDRIVWMDNRNGNLDIYMYNTSTSEETQITTNESMKAYPDLYNDRIVWADYRNGNWDIYMYDLSTKKEIRITTNESNQERPAIYGDKIVWEDKRNGDTDIYMCIISEQEEGLHDAGFSASSIS